MIACELPEESEVKLRALVEAHHRRTGSALAATMLEHWEAALTRFRQVVPVARVQAQAPPEPVADPSTENAPKTAA